MPLGNVYHGDPTGASQGLARRIEVELRARIEDAVDFACLDLMARRRNEAGAEPPIAGHTRDHAEFTAYAVEFLERLRAGFVAELDDEQCRRLGAALARSTSGDIATAIDVQVRLARELPDYWQRFEAIRLATTPEPSGSGGQGRGLLRRLLGRGDAPARERP